MLFSVYDPEGRFSESSTLSFDTEVEVGDIELLSPFVMQAEILATEEAETGPVVVSVETEEGSLSANQPLFVYYPLLPNDVCEESRVGPSLLEGLHYRTEQGLSDGHGEGLDCIDNGIEDLLGPDSWHRVLVPPETTLSLSAISLSGDIALAVYADCDSEQFLTCENYRMPSHLGPEPSPAG